MMLDDKLPEPIMQELESRKFHGKPPIWTGSDTPLMGCEAKLKALEAAWRQARTGRMQIVLVKGEWGLGKSRLVQEFLAQHSAEDATMLSTQVFSHDQGTSFHTADCLYHHLRYQGIISQMSTAFLAEIASFEADLHSDIRVLGNIKKVSAETVYQRRLRAYVVLFAALAQERPLIITIDGLHWIDAASARVFTELLVHTPEVGQLPLLFVATLRPMDELTPCHGLCQALGLHRTDVHRELEMQLFDQSTVRRIIEYRLGRVAADQHSNQLYKHTKGNPRFLLETIKILEDRGDWQQPNGDLPLPGTIKEIIFERKSMLQPVSQQCLEIAAVIERNFHTELMQRVVELPEPDVKTAINDLVRRGFVFPIDGPDDFLIDELTRNIINPDLQNKEGYHQKVGLAIETTARNPPRPTEIQQMADHFYCAKLWDKALNYSISAGLDAVGRFDIEMANRFLKYAEEAAEKKPQAFGPKEKARYHQGKGDVYQAENEPEKAIESYMDALDIIAGQSYANEQSSSLPPGIDVCYAADLARRIGRQYGWQGEISEALAWMERARDWLGEAQAPAERDELAWIETHTASLLFQKGELEEAEKRCRRALELLGNNGDMVARAEAWNMLGSVLDQRGSRADALRAFEKSINTWKSLGNAFEKARVENNRAIVIACQGNLEEARTIYKTILDYFQRHLKDKQRTAVTLTNLGRIDAMIGDYEAAAENHRQALKLAVDIEVPWLQAIARVNLGWVFLQTGRIAEAEREAQAVIQPRKDTQVMDSLPEAWRLRGTARLERGELKRARAYGERALDSASEQGNRPEEAGAERLLGQVQHLTGEPAAALRHLDRSLQICEQVGDRFETAQSHWQLALAKRDLGAGSDAFHHLVQALTAFAQLPARGMLKTIRSQGELTMVFPTSPVDALEACESEMAGWGIAAGPQPESSLCTSLILEDVQANLCAAEAPGGATVTLTLEAVSAA